MIGACRNGPGLEWWMAHQNGVAEQQPIKAHLASGPSCQLRVERQPTWRGPSGPARNGQAIATPPLGDKPTVLRPASDCAAA